MEKAKKSNSPLNVTVGIPSASRQFLECVLVKNFEILKTRGHSHYDESSEKKVNTIVYLPHINLLKFIF